MSYSKFAFYAFLVTLQLNMYDIAMQTTQKYV